MYSLPNDDPPKALHVGEQFKALSFLQFDLNIGQLAFAQELWPIFDDLIVLLVDNGAEFLELAGALGRVSVHHDGLTLAERAFLTQVVDKQTGYKCLYELDRVLWTA